MWIEKFDNPQKNIFQILNEKEEINSNFINYLKNFNIDILLKAYENMCFSRIQEKMQMELNYEKDESGKIKLINNFPKIKSKVINFLSSKGQEGVEVAYASCLRKGIDWFVPAYRNNAAWITAGYPVEKIIQYWLGNEMGSQIPKEVNILPINIPIATQCSHAAGIAFAEKYRQKQGIVITTIGDGGTSEGEFYEAINFAAINKLPVIFFIENNQWSLDTPTSKATLSPTFAQKGTAFGVPNIFVDGNDFFAVYYVTQEAILRAKNNNGPSLIEAVTYRQNAHSAFDIKKDYFSSDDYRIEQEWLKKDPIIRIKKYLNSINLWDDIKEKQLFEKITKKVNDAIIWAFKNQNVTIDEIFDYIYKDLTPKLINQKKEAYNFFNQGEKFNYEKE